MVVELDSRAAIATTALTSSFLPKCSQFLQVKVAHSPPSKTSFHGAVASTKQKKKGRKSSSPTRGWAYEHFMVLWDEVFEHCCTDPVKATQIRNLSCKGVARHGRGCVLVFQEVQTRPRGSGIGFTSKPPKASRRVPDFVTLDYHAVYLPREFLVDPRKAPLEEDIGGSDSEERPPDNAARIVVEKQGDGSNEIIDASESQHNDTKMGIDESGGKVIDIEEIIREAQDVYSFYSDDEDESDESDDATDDDDDPLLDLDDEEGDTNTTASLIVLDDDIEKGKPTGLDGKEGDSTLHRDGRDAEYNMANDNDTGRLNSSERFDNHESPLLIFEEDDEIEPHVIDSLSPGRQNEENLNANGVRMFVDESAQLEHNCDDAVHCTQTDTKEGHGGNRNFDIECCTTSRLRKSDDSASVFQYESGMEEIKGNIKTKIQVEGNGGTHARCDGLGSIGTTGPIVELLDESSGADTFKSSGLVANEKGRHYQGNKVSEDEEVQLATQQMLNACMRGMDRTRLMSLTANFDFEAERFRFGRKMAVIDMKTSDAGGEEPYNPSEEELVLLLHLRIDGKPAYGADVVVAYRDESQTIGDEQDSWKLRGKYRNIFS